MLSQVERFKRRYAGQNIYESTRPRLEIVPLDHGSGRVRLKGSLLESKGKAVVVVHPFFPEGDAVKDSDEERLKYRNYTDRLRRTVGACAKLGIPVILFETQNRVVNLSDTLSRMGIQNGRVYVVPTLNGEPEPIHTRIDKFSNDLRKLGLKKALVLGSYLLTKGSKLDGCVGYTTKVLSKARIDAKPGVATFPKGGVFGDERDDSGPTKLEDILYGLGNWEQSA